MSPIFKILTLSVLFVSCGRDFNIDDHSDRRQLRKGVQQGADAQAERSSGDNSKDTNYSDSNASDDLRKTGSGDSNPDDSTQDNTTPDDTANDTPNDEPQLDPAAQGDPNIVVFRIASGTGTGSWNTQQTMIRATVGQTVRFVNDDTIVHRLHTNGAPCPHGTQFQPGSTYDCVVTRTFNSAAGPLYDHNVGTSAQVWIETTNANAAFSLIDEREVEKIERPAARCEHD